MLSDIRPRAHQRYAGLPILGSILDEFATWSCSRGYALGTVRNQLKAARQIDGFFCQQGVQRLKDLTLCVFETAWRHYCHNRPNIAATVRKIESFLEELGHLGPAALPQTTPTLLELDRYASYLRSVRGLAETTIRAHTRCLQKFLDPIEYGNTGRALADLTSKHIEGFLCTCSRRLNRYSLQHVVAHLRAFLRYQYQRGVVRTPLHETIDTPRVYRLEQLPRCLPWETVKALLESIDRTNAHGMRDYAMLFLAAAYGLRTCDIVSLTLDDIDWRGGSIRIPQRKTGRSLLLPLTESVGDVLIEYLKRGRPDHPCRNLFLRVRAPSGPLKPTAVTEVFQRRVLLSGLNIPYQGPHCLRHSYAVHLLRQGTSTKAIGDLLGHRSAESTCVYLRLAIEDLRDVALPVPELRNGDLFPKTDAAKRSASTEKRKGCSRPHAKTSTSLRSSLAGEIQEYLRLKHALGRNYAIEGRTLHGLDAFLAEQYPQAQAFEAEMFNQWRTTLQHLAPTVRRRRMQIVRNFCLYRRRSKPREFVPDPLTFPAPHQPCAPYLFSESEIARIISATQYLQPVPRCPLRSRTMHLAITLLYTTGLRRGELLRLALGDFNAAEATLRIQATKFHKSRLVPLSSSVARELTAYLALRRRTRLPMETNSPLIWNGYGGPEGKAYSGSRLASTWRALCRSLGILNRQAKPPRVHDLRHSFAVNVLRRWYQSGEDVQAKLPQLSTYMGHVSIVSTHYYLPFVEDLRSEASNRFHQTFGNVIRTSTADSEQNEPEGTKRGQAQ